MREKVTLILIEDNEVDSLNFERCLSDSPTHRTVLKFERAETFLVGVNFEAPPEGPVVIFLDLTLPGLSGFELLAILRANKFWGEVPVFITTSSTDPVDFEKAHRFGVSGYFCKPLDEENFARVLDSISLIR